MNIFKFLIFSCVLILSLYINVIKSLDYPNLELYKEGFLLDIKTYKVWENLLTMNTIEEWEATSYFNAKDNFYQGVLTLFNDREDLTEHEKRKEAIKYINKVEEIERFPFRTETNRYADGSTSSGSFSATSPSFPQYKGFLASPEGRHEGYLNYSQSCKEQGLGVFGAGDADKEAALQAAYAANPNLANTVFQRTFIVDASIKWNPSQFCIQKDESYEIYVEGTQYWQDGGILVDSNGYNSYYDALSNCYVAMGRCRGHLKKKRRLPRSNWMALSCSIGPFVLPLQEVNPESDDIPNYLPIDESTLQETIFEVGEHKTIINTPHTGQLICFANDAHLNYWNNVGTISVTVKRISSSKNLNTPYYKPLRLPACDSALIVYAFHGDQQKAAKYCNAAANGAGWKLENIKPEEYSGGELDLDSFYLPLVEDRYTTKPPYVQYESPYESQF